MFGPIESGAARITIHEQARWLVLPDRRVVECAPHKLLRRLLGALVRARIERPGEPVGVAALLAAGWPGEQILPGAARNRIRVALSRLRRLGLEGLLVRDPDGWLISTAIEVELSDAPAAS